MTSPHMRSGRHTAERWQPTAYARKAPQPEVDARVSPTNRNRHGVAGPDWGPALVGRLNEILALPEGWDGRRAATVDVRAVAAAVKALNDVMGPRLQLPHISPSADGGLLLTWGSGDFSLEVWVDPDGDRWVSYEHSAANWEGDYEDKGMREGVREVLLHLAGDTTE